MPLDMLVADTHRHRDEVQVGGGHGMLGLHPTPHLECACAPHDASSCGPTRVSCLGRGRVCELVMAWVANIAAHSVTAPSGPSCSRKRGD
jgi:hypothetical protein